MVHIPLKPSPKCLQPPWSHGAHPMEEKHMKMEVIEKLILEPKLRNMIFRTNKMRNAFKRWASYLKNWVNCRKFRESRLAKSQFLILFDISKSHSILEISAKFFCKLPPILREIQPINSNMGSETFPSFIFMGVSVYSSKLWLIFAQSSQYYKTQLSPCGWSVISLN